MSFLFVISRWWASLFQPYHPFLRILCYLSWFLKGRSGRILASSRYGVRVTLDLPEDIAYSGICSIGAYETGTTELLRYLFRPGDTFIDIGANIGWYSLHFGRFVNEGQCHAFEPLPEAVCKLKRNITINLMHDRINVHPLALGSHKSRSTLYRFDDSHHFLSSFSSLNREDARGVEVEIITLDDLFESGVIGCPDIIKVDVEGFELSVLDGAVRMLSSISPVWVFEMNEETSEAFGYSPADLLNRICQYADYRFIRVPFAWGCAQPMDSPENYQNSDNIVCYVKKMHWERIRNIPYF